MKLRGTFAALTGWASAGILFGAVVSALTVRGNASLQGAGQALPTMCWLEALYVGASTLAGLIIGLSAPRRLATEGFRAHWTAGALAGLTCFAALSFTQWAITRLTWHGPEDGYNELASSVAALLAASIANFLLARHAQLTSAAVTRTLVIALLAGVSICAALVINATPQRPTASATQTTPIAAAAPSSRVMVIGIDGLDWDRLDPLVAQGRCPNFAKLIRGGYRAPLTTIEPTFSPIIWNTIATGLGWELHGIEGFTQIEIPLLERGAQSLYTSGGSRPRIPAYCGLRYLLSTLVRSHLLHEVPISGDHRRAKAFWNILSDAGVDVGVVRWWATWPAETLRGHVVSDNDPLSHQLAKSKLHGDEAALQLEHMTSPNSLALELIPLVDPAIGDPVTSSEALEAVLADPMLADLTEEERARHRADPMNLRVFEILRRGDRFSTRAALNLWKEKKVSMCAVYLRAVDNISHRFWSNTGVVDHVYEFTDVLLGDLLAEVDESTTVVLVSDHGWCYEPGPRFAHPDAPDGVLIVSGPGVAAGALEDGEPKPSVFDIAPTVLALYGLPQDRHQTGHTLVDAFTADSPVRDTPAAIESWGAHHPRWTRSTSDAEQSGREEAVRLLRHLGYLD